MRFQGRTTMRPTARPEPSCNPISEPRVEVGELSCNGRHVRGRVGGCRQVTDGGGADHHLASTALQLGARHRSIILVLTKERRTSRTEAGKRHHERAARLRRIVRCLGADPEQHPEPYARLGEGRLERLAADRQEPRRTPRVDERHGHHRHRQTDQDIDQACLEDVRACRPAEHEGVDDGEHGVATL